MRFAVIYSGYLGNIKRCLNSLKKNVLHSPTDEIDVFFATKKMSVNKIRLINLRTLGVITIDGPTYTKERIIDGSPFSVASIQEIGNELEPSYEEEKKKFVDRTRGYHSDMRIVDNYDKVNEVILESIVPNLFDQYYLVSMCIKEIILYEIKKQIKYEFIIRTRDKYTFGCPIPRSSFIEFKGISLLGNLYNPIFMMDSFLIGRRDAIIKLFSDFYKKIGGYRSTFDWRENWRVGVKEGDHTFSGEGQFTMHMLSMFKKEDLNFLGYKIYPNYTFKDSYGDPYAFERNIEVEYQVNV